MADIASSKVMSAPENRAEEEREVPCISGPCSVGKTGSEWSRPRNYGTAWSGQRRTGKRQVTTEKVEGLEGRLKKDQCVKM